jgi:putative ABC transport system permease protein
MIKNYFKIAIRNIKRHSTYSILNITGMAFGMTCAILILILVQDEWSYDRHFKNANEMYRVIENQNLSAGSSSIIVPVPGALAPLLKEEYPEILRSVRFCPNPLTLKKGEEFIEEMVLSVDRDFLKMFDVKFVRGDINTALNDPHNIILTEETARKYFGNSDPLGKTIASRGFEVKVTGIVRSMPGNSHVQFNILIPIEWLSGLGAHTNDWNERFNTYIELKKGTSYKIFEGKIHDIIKKHNKESKSELFLQNIKQVHLYSSGKYIADNYGTGDIIYVRILSLIAVFILAIACINFLNLTTAQSSKRAAEIGIRKVAGAGRRKIVFQFLGETLIIVVVAHIIAMILVELLLPSFNILTGKQLSVNYHGAGLFFGLAGVIIFCTITAGAYPAFYLSSLEPLKIIKGTVGNNHGHVTFRRVLVVFQFSISVILIICTLVVQLQLRFIRNKNLGFNRDNIGYFMFPTRPSDPKLDAFKKELAGKSDILNVTRAGNPFFNSGTVKGFFWEGNENGGDIDFSIIGVDADYAGTYRLEMKEGRFFSTEFSSDKNAIVINEEAARILGFKDPVGKIITGPGGTKLNIIGLVKDFHFQSLHHKISPMIMQPGESNNFYVRMKPGKTLSALENIGKTFKSFDPGLPLDFHFLDDDYDRLYLSEKRAGRIFLCFSLLAIVISCLGLVGLSSFMTQRRTKEIGIRKINGSRSVEIFSLLSGEYIVLVMISIFIACPVAWYSMNRWLQNFAYRINMSWWIFTLAGVIALLIAMLTVSWQSYKAANRNPVDALRYE